MKGKLGFTLLPIQIVLWGACFGTGNLVNPEIEHQLYLKIIYKEALPNDTLRLTLTDVYNKPVKGGIFKSIASNGVYKFKIAVVQEYGFFELTTKRRVTQSGGANDLMPLLYTQFWETGDSLNINLSHQETGAGISSTCSFYGSGAEKYKAKYEIDNFEKDHPDVQDAVFYIDLKKDTAKTFSPAIQQKLQILKAYEGKISARATALLKAQVLFSFRTYPLYLIKKYYRDSVQNNLARRQYYLKKYEDLYCNVEDLGIDQDLLAESGKYLYYKIQCLTTQSVLLYGHYEPDSVYMRITALTTGKLRENLVLSLFSSQRNSSNMLGLVEDARKWINSSNALRTLQEIEDRLQGHSLPNYSFTDRNGKKISLSHFKGKVILVDIWFDGCGGCAKYFKEVLSPLEYEFKKNNNVIFLSVSLDKSRSRWLKGISSGSYTSKDAVNINTNGMGASHPLMTDSKIVAVPTAILLNKKGRIAEFNSTTLYNLSEAGNAIRKLLKIK